MAATFQPLKSDYGFESPGFVVSPTGNVTINGELTVPNEISVQQIFVQGVPLLENLDSTISLANEIKNSNLSGLGVLEKLEVDGDVYIGIASTNFITIDNGTIVVTSQETGSLDNMNIGLNTPANADFLDVNIGTTGNNKILSVYGTVSVDGAASITTATITTGVVTTLTSNTGTISDLITDEIAADDITINNTPTELFHSTRKDYVDNRITAFSIAFGA